MLAGFSVYHFTIIFLGLLFIILGSHGFGWAPAWYIIIILTGYTVQALYAPSMYGVPSWYKGDTK